jgi:hypothetical protein
MGDPRSRPWACRRVGSGWLAVLVALGALLVTAPPVGGQTSETLTASPSSGVAGSAFTLTPAGFPAGVGCNTLTYLWKPGTGQTTLGSGQPVNAAFHTHVPSGATPATYPIEAYCTIVTGGQLAAVSRFTVTPTPTTTTTTTTTSPTTTTTRPATTTTTRPSSTTTTAAGTTSTTTNGTTTTANGATSTTVGSSTASSSRVSIDTTPTTVPGQAPVTANTYLRLTALAVAPGAAVSANGRGCDAGAPVVLTIGLASVGRTRASASGAFHAPLSLGPLGVGRYTVVARCGVILAAPLDIVLASRVSAATSTLAIILFVLLIGALAFRRQIFPRAPRRPSAATTLRGSEDAAGA